MHINSKMQNTTWDSKSVSNEPPFGASIIVYRISASSLEFLILHRAHKGVDFEGDWAWTPPAGARFPKENMKKCALRELKEETGLELKVQKTNFGTKDWVVFMTEAYIDTQVIIDSEHDRFEWMNISTATNHCRPNRVAKQIKYVAKAILGNEV